MDLTDIIKKSVGEADPEPETNDEFVPSADPDPIEGETEPETPDEDADLQDASDEVAEVEETPEPVVAEVVPEPEAQKPPVVDAEDEFAKEHGIKSKDKSGRENRIPYSQVKRINANAVTKAKESWEKELKPLVAARDARIKEYEERLTKVGNTEKVMFEDEGTFLGMLIDAIPGYAKLLGEHVNRDEHGRVTGLKAAGPQVNPSDPEPQPDVDMGNGQIGYSPDQFKKLRAWDTRQAEERAYLRAKKDIGADFKPIKDVFEMGQQQRQQQEARDKEINEAFKWPGFQENFDAILKAMNDDSAAKKAGTQEDYKFASMRDAYNHVLNLKANAVTETAAQMEARIRKEVNEALRRAPRATSAGASAVAVPAGRGEEENASKSTADLVRASLKAR